MSKQKKIEVTEYNPEWPAMFEEEKSIILDALGKNCVAIHHVGSTSVPGLIAKPKIDIIAVANDRQKAITDLEKVELCIRENGIFLCNADLRKEQAFT